MLFSCGACRSLDRLVIFPPNVVFGEQEMQLYGLLTDNWGTHHGQTRVSASIHAWSRLVATFARFFRVWFMNKSEAQLSSLTLLTWCAWKCHSSRSDYCSVLDRFKWPRYLRTQDPRNKCTRIHCFNLTKIQLPMIIMLIVIVRQMICLMPKGQMVSCCFVDGINRQLVGWCCHLAQAWVPWAGAQLKG